MAVKASELIASGATLPRGVNPDVIEVALAHKERNDVRRAYNRAKSWQESIALLQSWADMLDELRQLSTVQRQAA